jgi:hypothetical protein
MADNLIRWKRGDYVKLSKAVNKFNKQVNELQSKGYNYLPEVRNYQSLKEDIYTRKELNRLINSMKKFNIETAKKVEVAGEEMTAWEYKEIKLARNRARRYLETRLEVQELENPYAKFGLETKEIEATRKTIQSLDKLEKTADKFQFNRIMNRIKNLGSYDVEMKRASLYRENYMKALEQMSNYDNYDLLKEKLDSIKNPEEFYKYISQSTTLSDLFNYYETSPTSQTYGGFNNNQEAFNSALRQLGVLEDIELVDLSDQVVSIL